MLLLVGCSSGVSSTRATAPSQPQASSADQTFLSHYDLAGKTAEQIIDHLDRLGGEARPAALTASVHPDRLLLSDARDEVALDLPKDRFYVSVAPYVNDTHDCFFHSLTTCKGELGAKDVHVKIIDAEGNVVIDEMRTTFDNGFAGFWLPRGIAGTIEMSYGDKSGRVPFATRSDSATCLTALRMT
jgi:hypothetical protein